MADSKEMPVPSGGLPSVAALSPLPRAIFLLHRIEKATHAEIAARLDVTQAVVEFAIAHVLVNLVRMREGRALRPCIYAEVDAAEASLLEVFRAEEAVGRNAIAADGRTGSPSLRAWGGETDFDIWLWYQVVTESCQGR